MSHLPTTVFRSAQRVRYFNFLASLVTRQSKLYDFNKLFCFCFAHCALCAPIPHFHDIWSTPDLISTLTKLFNRSHWRIGNLISHFFWDALPLGHKCQCVSHIGLWVFVISHYSFKRTTYSESSEFLLNPRRGFWTEMTTFTSKFHPLTVSKTQPKDKGHFIPEFYMERRKCFANNFHMIDFKTLLSAFPPDWHPWILCGLQSWLTQVSKCKEQRW